MLFTSYNYLYFFVLIFSLYWIIPSRKAQNVLLLIASYVFYGWVTPWFCILIASSTLVDFSCGLAFQRFHRYKKAILTVSLVFNLGLLCTYKYFDFFSTHVALALDSIGLSISPILLNVMLPVGISFYTFQTLSYTIDIYRGQLTPRKSLLDFALFVAFFPQLVAGPIERATRLLPQIEKKRNWDWRQFYSAWSLILRGLFKKLVIADNLSFYVDKVFMMETPGLCLLVAGTLAFGAQIYGDFSGYTDIARGSARMLGFDLTRNFNLPYWAVTPSDFWRRWHISLSSWIKDYLYISLGGRHSKTRSRNMANLMIAMSLCGLWHGAGWNFIVWGVYHGVALVVFHYMGLGGHWTPRLIWQGILSRSVVFVIVMFGWLIFRSPSLEWLSDTLANIMVFPNNEQLVVSFVIILLTCLYCFPVFISMVLEKIKYKSTFWWPCFNAALLLLVVIFHSDAGNDFIYFQF